MSHKQDNRNANRRWVGPREKYDLIKEGLIALVVIFVLIVVLNVVFGAPRVQAISFQMWAQNDPQDFAATALTELIGTSETATYGPPYNDQTGQLQNLGPLEPQKWAGITMPVNPPEDFVLKPLDTIAAFDPALKTAVDQWRNASDDTRNAWINVASNATVTVDGTTVTIPGGDTGPAATIIGALLKMAQGGSLTSQVIDAPGDDYSMNYTRSLLFLADSNYLGQLANTYAMTGPQWGVMNEIGSWPGQPWLWWYTMFYNIPGWSSIGTDILAATSALVFIVLFGLLLPFIPGLRSIPRWIRVYRLIWRPYYRRYGDAKNPRRASPPRS